MTELTHNAPRARISNRRLVDLEGADHYPTPSWGVQALLNHVEVTGPILEPCCGAGRMVEVLRAAGHQVTASDLHDYGCGEVRDFFDIKKKWRGSIITNPPYKHAEEMLHHALDLASGKVAFLVRLAFLESIGRYNRLFSTKPPILVLIFSERLSLYPKGKPVQGGGMVSHAWLVWDRAARSGPPQIKWVAPGLKPRSSRGRT